jgi:hypothetical protein
MDIKKDKPCPDCGGIGEIKLKGLSEFDARGKPKIEPCPNPDCKGGKVEVEDER